jgi:hypothetical protein
MTYSYFRAQPWNEMAVPEHCPLDMSVELVVQKSFIKISYFLKNIALQWKGKSQSSYGMQSRFHNF